MLSGIFQIVTAYTTLVREAQGKTQFNDEVRDTGFWQLPDFPYGKVENIWAVNLCGLIPRMPICYDIVQEYSSGMILLPSDERCVHSVFFTGSKIRVNSI